MTKEKITMKNNHIYDHIIIGAGIAGSSIAYELNKYTNNILIIEKEDQIAPGASGAAGGLMSPLLGKPNKFKTLVNDALKYSTNFYKSNIPNHINQCGTLRIPKDKNDEKKFQEYIPFIDMPYKIEQGGCFFPEASVVNSHEICKALIGLINIHYNQEVKTIQYNDNIWNIDNKYYTKNLVLATGASSMLVDEFYLNIRAIWGQRIDISTTSCINYNYHKECSVTVSSKINENLNKLSIGATHHRFVNDKKIDKNDTYILLQRASDIVKLNDIKVINEYAGARAASVDYFPIVGKIIDSQKTLEEFPYLKNGTNVQLNRFTRYDNLYILNGVGGRGFVFAPYLAKQLCDLIINNIEVQEEINTNRLFKREVKRLK